MNNPTFKTLRPIDAAMPDYHNRTWKMNYEATSNRVILINPPVHDFAAFDFWAKPMGLLVIAEELKKHGIEPTLIDALDPYHPALEGLPLPTRKAHGKGKFYAEEIPKPAPLADVPLAR